MYRLFKTLGVLFLIIAIILILFLGKDKPAAKTTPENIQSIIYDKLGLKCINVNIDSVDSNNFLALINSEYPVNDKSFGNATVPTFKIVPSINSSVVLNQTTLTAVKNLLDDARKEGFAGLFVNSGYRTFDEQKQLYDHAADKAYVQKPNNSEHQTGLAVDIACNGMDGGQMAGSKQGKWLLQNAWKYGFVLRYPGNKSDITKIAYEPWHYRYIGLPHSYCCYKNNLCFEEYIKFLKDHSCSEVKVGAIRYGIFYETPQSGMIQVPENSDYEISKDNTGGYIITVKEN